MKLTAEAKKLLRRVKRMMLAEPRRVSMDIWRLERDGWEHDDTAGGQLKKGFPKCGTVGCIGGWVEALYYADHPRRVRKSADKILGLEWGQAQNLFYPDELMNSDKGQTRSHAKKVSAHIDDFIRREG